MNLKEALELAAQEELAAMNRYIQLALEVEDPETRIMLEQIAKEEAVHLKKLKERLKAISLVG
jgi:rubrerythrin